MADSTVAEQQNTIPAKQLDTNQTTNDAGTTVHRQRVEDPELMAVLRAIRSSLTAIAQCFRPALGPTGLPALQVTTMSPVDPITGFPVARELVSSDATLATGDWCATLNSFAGVDAGTNVVSYQGLGTPILGQIPAVWLLNALPETQRGSVVTS